MNNRCKSMLCVLGLVSLSLSATATSAAELQLAGIRLGRSALTILQKYGNPSEVLIGATTQTTFSGNSSGAKMPGGVPGMPGGMPGMPGGMPAMPGGMPMMPGGMPGMPGGMPAMPGGMPMMPGGMPTMPGGMPGMPGMTMPGGSGNQSQTTKITEVTWVYKLSKGRTAEFIINADGRVIQISAFGVAWPGVQTSLGLKLGSTYKDVLRKYGWPESHDKKGIELVMKYPEKHRATFTLLDQTVVGLTIALMD